MNTIGNSCFALGISPKREKCFGVLSSTKAFIFLENFERKLFLKKAWFLGWVPTFSFVQKFSQNAKVRIKSPNFKNKILGILLPTFWTLL